MVTNQKTYSVAWRLLFDSALFLLVFWTPPIFTFIIGAALLFVFPRFYEFLTAAFLLDMLYSVPTPFWGEFQLVFSTAALVCLIAFTWAKRRVRF